MKIVDSRFFRNYDYSRKTKLVVGLATFSRFPARGEYKMKRSIILFGLLTMVCGVCFADQVIEKPVTADTAEKFAEVAAGIRKEMTAGGRYEYIRPDQKGKVEADLNTIAQMLQQSGPVSAMRNDQKVQLFNVQENLNGILTHSDKNRLVCENTASVGTQIRTNKCRTFGDIQRERTSSKQFMDYKAETVPAPKN